MSNDFRDSRSPLFQTRKRTFVSDIERGIYDIKDKIDYQYSTGMGLNEDVVRKISARKLEPKWMLDLRLQSLQYFFERPMPDWGADISDLNIQEIIHYIVSDEKPMATDWDQVPEEIKQTFDRLGIPKAEQTSLAGVGASGGVAVGRGDEVWLEAVWRDYVRRLVEQLATLHGRDLAHCREAIGKVGRLFLHRMLYLCK